MTCTIFIKETNGPTIPIYLDSEEFESMTVKELKGRFIPKDECKWNSSVIMLMVPIWLCNLFELYFTEN